MSDVVISVENLGKRYRISHQRTGPRDGLRHVLNQWATAPLRAVRSILSQQNHKSEVENRKSTEDFWALKNVSFEVKQGEVVGIIGRNGAGKSTLLKVLSRITEPTEGRVRIKGRVASLLEVGTGFHPELTGRENIFLNGAILGMSKTEIKAKFDEIVDFAEVEKFLDTPVKRYSSGMYVRLAFAVAAHLEPEILIVDEVLAVGDSEFQKKCLGKIQRVSKGDGRTVIFVTHQLGMVREICSKSILLKSGCTEIIGDVDSVLTKYLSNNSEPASRRRALHIRSVRGLNGEQDLKVFFGEPLAVLIHLDNLPDLPLGINVAVRNSIGKVICLFSTNPHDGISLPKERELTVEFSMNQCCLAPGEYHLDVALTEPAVRIITEVESALNFEVIARRLGGTWPYEARFGEYFPPHRWSLANLSRVGQERRGGDVADQVSAED